MSRIRVSLEVPGQASAAEELWYDLTRWPAFVDGFTHVERQTGDWPQTGGQLTWATGPAGRGRVLETVTAYEARSGQTTDVEDGDIRGTQVLTFEPRADSVQVTLELTYKLKKTHALGPVFDWFFVRRPMRDTMSRTLLRFRREVVSDAELAA